MAQIIVNYNQENIDINDLLSWPDEKSKKIN